MSYPQDEFGWAPGQNRNRQTHVVNGSPWSSTALSVYAGASSVGSGVMALDTGNVPDEFRAHPDWKDPAPSIADAQTLGDGLRQAREASGRSLAELSQATRVHSRYLIALEQNDWSSLPSRVFAIGHVRAYAGELGLDEQLAIERYKRECPDPSVPLQAPVGIAFEEVRRHSPRLIAAAAVLVLAVVGWNVFQRVSLMRAPHPSDIAEVPESWTLGAVPGQTGVQTLRLDAALPAPPDQTVPAFYVTPGLESQLSDFTTGGSLAAPQPVSTGPVQKAFNPRGAVYGASATASHVTLQARKPSTLVVRMGDRVLFARQLAPGEAWRAPVGVSATLDVSDPTAFDVYLNGEHGGGLAGPQTPLAQLNTRALTIAHQIAAENARVEAARAAAAQVAATEAADRAVEAAPPAASTPIIVPTSAEPEPAPSVG